jgi:signal transduction histidine kinase
MFKRYQKEKSNYSFELKNTIIYIFLGFLWIVFTSEAVLLITLSPEQIAKIEIYKGIGYVIVTGFLLFYFIRRRIKVEKYLFGKLRETRKELIKNKDILEVKNKTLEEYAFIISHNIRRPLANILGLTELLNTSETKELSTNEIITKLKQSAEELDDLVNKSNKLLRSKNE